MIVIETRVRFEVRRVTEDAGEFRAKFLNVGHCTCSIRLYVSMNVNS